MNYNSVEEIFAAGITNMEILRNNSRQDDGTDTITGVDWFMFNGTPATNIYANGNSWIGFGSSAEHLKVNRRDSAMWFLYKEEGTLYDHYRFLKIRWKGYSAWSATDSASSVEYDVILWDTGDISLHMISIPTSNNTGTYALAVAASVYSYTVSTDSPDVTFIKTDAGFDVQNSAISLMLPYEKRFLIRDGSTVYTVIDSALSSLGTVALTSSLFLNSGTNKMPDISLLRGLSNPEILYWHDITTVASGLSIAGIPPLPQIILYETITVNDSQKIKIMEAAASKDAVFTITTNNGMTWQYYNGTAWITSSDILEGMTNKRMKAITPEQWQSITGTCQIRCVLPSTTSYISKLAIGYID